MKKILTILIVVFSLSSHAQWNSNTIGGTYSRLYDDLTFNGTAYREYMIWLQTTTSPGTNNLRYEIDQYGRHTYYPAYSASIFTPGSPAFGTSNGGQYATARFMNSGGSSLSAYSVQSVDWGQNIQSYVSRNRTVSFVTSFNGLDRSYVDGFGNHVARSYWATSDEGLKENIATITYALDKVNELRGVYFTYIGDETCGTCDSDSLTIANDESTHMGVIADEVELVCPEVVRTEPINSYKVVNYNAMIGLLIEAIKEVDDKIDNCCEARMQMAVKNMVPTDCKLLTATPNPSGSQDVMIYYTIPDHYHARVIYIFDLSGRLIKSYTATGNNISIRSADFQDGMYLYSLFVDGVEVDSKKMLITK